MIEIILPGITALLFIGIGIGWLLATVRPHSWISQRWYGRKWAEHFLPVRKSSTLLRACAFAGFYLLAGVAFLLRTIRYLSPTFWPTTLPIEWVLLIIGMVWMGTALLFAQRQQHANDKNA